MERGLHAIIVRIELEMCINFAQVYISVTDEVKDHLNSEFATGPLYVHTEFKTISMLPEDVAFLNPWAVGSRKVGIELVQGAKI